MDGRPSRRGRDMPRWYRDRSGNGIACLRGGGTGRMRIGFQHGFDQEPGDSEADRDCGRALAPIRALPNIAGQAHGLLPGAPHVELAAGSAPAFPLPLGPRQRGQPLRHASRPLEAGSCGGPCRLPAQRLCEGSTEQAHNIPPAVRVADQVDTDRVGIHGPLTLPDNRVRCYSRAGSFRRAASPSPEFRPTECEGRGSGWVVQFPSLGGRAMVRYTGPPSPRWAVRLPPVGAFPVHILAASRRRRQPGPQAHPPQRLRGSPRRRT